jgi:hypothetical protein
LVNDPENILCDGTGEYGGIVKDAFESNNTIALESFNRYRIFDTVHMIRNTDGFQKGDVSINPQDEDTKYLVAMSK